MSKLSQYKKLEGKEIKSACLLNFPNRDDLGFLKLTFTDKTSVIIESSYGGYTGNSLDEYPTYLNIIEDFRDYKTLIAVKESDFNL